MQDLLNSITITTIIARFKILWYGFKPMPHQSLNVKKWNNGVWNDIRTSYLLHRRNKIKAAMAVHRDKIDNSLYSCEKSERTLHLSDCTYFNSPYFCDIKALFQSISTQRPVVWVAGLAPPTPPLKIALRYSTNQDIMLRFVSKRFFFFLISDQWPELEGSDKTSLGASL